MALNENIMLHGMERDTEKKMEGCSSGRCFHFRGSRKSPKGDKIILKQELVVNLEMGHGGGCVYNAETER